MLTFDDIDEMERENPGLLLYINSALRLNGIKYEYSLQEVWGDDYTFIGNKKIVNKLPWKSAEEREFMPVIYRACPAIAILWSDADFVQLDRKFAVEDLAIIRENLKVYRENLREKPYPKLINFDKDKMSGRWLYDNDTYNSTPLWVSGYGIRGNIRGQNVLFNERRHYKAPGNEEIPLPAGEYILCHIIYMTSIVEYSIVETIWAKSDDELLDEIDKYRCKP